MKAKLQKASTLMSTLVEEISKLVVALPGNLLLDSMQGSANKNGCFAIVVHRTSIFHQK